MSISNLSEGVSSTSVIIISVVVVSFVVGIIVMVVVVTTIYGRRKGMTKSSEKSVDMNNIAATNNATNFVSIL